MFVKDGEGRGWLSQVWRASAGFLPVGRKGVCCHTQAVQGGGGCHRLGRRVSGWYQVMRKAFG